MADREVNFTIKATDEFSATFGNAARDIEGLRKQLSLPIQGPLTKAQQSLENNALAKIRTMETAGIRSRMDSLVENALGLGGGNGAGPDFSHLRGTGYDAMRMRGGLSASGSIAKAQDDLFKSLNEQKERLERMFKLGGAIGIADLIGRALQRLPDAIDDFHDALKAGATKTEAFGSSLANSLPGVGDLAKGIKGLYTALDADESERLRKQRAAEEPQDLRDMRQALNDRRTATRQAINQQEKDAYLNALDSLGVAGKQGDARAMAEAEAARNKANRQLDELAGKRGQLSPEDALKLDKQIALARAANDAEFEDKRREIFRQADAKETADRRAHADQLQSLNADAYTTDLERQGKYLEAKIIGIREEAAREREEAKRKYEDALKDPNQDPAVAAQRRDEALAAIQRRSEARQQAERQRAAREADQQRREFQRQAFDADQDMGARRLRMFGQADDAERAQARKGYADRLAEIKANLDQQVQANAERAPEFREQARRLAEQAGQEYGLTLDEIRQEQEQRMRPDFADTFGGNSALRRGALSRTAGAGGGTNYAEKIAKAGEEALKTAKESRDFLKTLAEAFKSGGLQIVVADSSN